MKVYADCAATTRICLSSFFEMREVVLKDWANPSSAHDYGDRARIKLDDAREKIASCINASPEEIYFTSGGTESNNWACEIGKHFSPVCYVSEIEHPSVMESAKARFRKFSTIHANTDGIIDPDAAEDEIRHDAAFISVMTANNEIGTIQPVLDLSHRYSKAYLFHADAVQAVGHIPVDVKELGVDMLSASAHKFHGPKGVGFLYVRKGTPMVPLHYGGGQERGMRSGTENVPGICGMATALLEATRNLPETMARVTRMRDKLIDGLLEIPGTSLNGSREHRLPGNVNICFDGVCGDSLALLLNQHGIAVSTGSACSTGDLRPSHVLKAIGLTDEQARSSIRITIDDYNTDAEIDYILDTVPECVAYLRRMSAYI